VRIPGVNSSCDAPQTTRDRARTSDVCSPSSWAQASSSSRRPVAAVACAAPTTDATASLYDPITDSAPPCRIRYRTQSVGGSVGECTHVSHPCARAALQSRADSVPPVRSSLHARFIAATPSLPGAERQVTAAASRGGPICHPVPGAQWRPRRPRRHDPGGNADRCVVVRRAMHRLGLLDTGV